MGDLNMNKSNETVNKRLKIIEGHVKKINKMVQNEEYCIDILHQSQAVQAALKKVDSLILQNHLHTCVVDAIKKGKKDEVIKEVMEVFAKNK